MAKISILFLFIVSLIVVLVNVFSGLWILPQYFTLGPLTIHYYGITMALAVGSGWWLAVKRAPKFGVDPAKADGLLPWLVLGGFVGARAYHVASSWQYYVQYPLDAFRVWHGGLSIFGALIGGIVVIVIYSRQFIFSSSPNNIGECVTGSTLLKFSKTLSVSETETSPPKGEKTKEWSIARRGTVRYNLQLLDWLAPSVLLGQIIGRFGNFFNYEAFGYPTNLPWKMLVPEGFRPMGFATSQYYHPLFLYEALGNVVILVVLLNFYKSYKSYMTYRAYKSGTLFFMYLFLYNALRFGLEYLRVDSTFVYEIFRLNVLVSGLLCIFGLLGYLVVTYVLSTPKNELD